MLTQHPCTAALLIGSRRLISPDLTCT